MFGGRGAGGECPVIKAAQNGPFCGQQEDSREEKALGRAEEHENRDQGKKQKKWELISLESNRAGCGDDSYSKKI